MCDSSDLSPSFSSKEASKSYLIRIAKRPDGLRIEVRALINGNLTVFHSFEDLNIYLADQAK